MTLVLVSNRLPVTIRQTSKGLEMRRSVGGVAIGLESVAAMQKAVWVGWPGVVPPRQRTEVERRLLKEFGAYPVFLEAPLVRRYYLGFVNRAIWPLFHYFSSSATYSPSEWSAYQKANELFCERLDGLLASGDRVWIHDSQLMLLPGLLRERRPNLEIGFFLHIPFPPWDLLRALPWRREILEGLLGADLIGFHTFDYAQAFLTGVRRLLGLDNDIGRLVVGHRAVQVDVFPMGIDFQRFALDHAETGSGALGSRQGPPAGGKLSFSLSRLDYTKGIPQQLLAIAAFLERHPEWRRKYTHLLVVSPSREKADGYTEMRRKIDELVGRINGQFGGLDWTPIRYIYRQIEFGDLIGLYRNSDVALITPLRDGMNLVAKEYLAARSDERGVLVLSEMAGAAKELTEALLVNPNNVDEVASALHEALIMPEQEQVRRNRAMRRRLEEYNLRRWASDFLESLENAAQVSKSLSVRLLAPDQRADILRAYRKARRRLLLLDYDGTLVPFAANPSDAIPPSSLRDRIQALAADPRNVVVLLSGRRREDLKTWFGGLGLTLVAEHGAWAFTPAEGRWRNTAPLENRWKDRIRPILEHFVNRIPGSSVEEKDYSLAWHYRKASLETGFAAAGDLIEALTNLTANSDLQVLSGSRVVEVKSTRMTKGLYFTSQLADKGWDFIFAVGDDQADESLFAALPQESHSIRVGLVASAARSNVESPEDILSLLGDMGGESRVRESDRKSFHGGR
ncbi:MAG TPA: bifunctional alpha,alpha-trehalose-phosphate synthase (UDP-forming)/trehalose-phosphatase [Thermoplasmata archaeon]|jgi:trehalose 6-phosphate synthase/phosphatase|nr:bifunctional alpha,alpha-trehalose-phosphate synthase (UDP-forming)/trehalose-phosphatase [Thermoplasmata archaeon]